MIILFHTLFLVTKYFFNVICTVFQPFSRGCEPVENETQISKIEYEGFKVTSEAVFDESGNPTFFPPVYVQRYLAVRSVLEDVRWNGKVRKVVDFGCAEFGLFPYLKHVPGLQEILTIDLDKDLLEQYKCRVAPLNSDYLKCREEPLEVQVLAGSISDTDECLLGCDAVICVELIEHLYPDTLEDVPYTVFGFIKPVVAVFTTPNSEFNVIFPSNKGFRHWDHKFEWTREQFYCWASNIIVRYPDYAVNFQDIGPGPPGTEAVGACSQMAVFIKKMKCNIQETSESTKSIQKESALQKYTLVRQYVYPHRVDTRTEEMKIRDQAEYSIRMLSTCDEFKKDDRVEIPLAAVLPTVEKWTKSVQTLRKLLEEAGWNMVEQEPNCLAVVYSWSRSSSESSLRSDSCEAYEWYKGIPENSTYDVVEENWDTDLTDEKTFFSSWQTMNVFSVPNPDGCVNNELVKPGFPMCDNTHTECLH